MNYCKQSDRHEPRIQCGYPLPCPHHTVIIDLSGEVQRTTIPLQSAAQSPGIRKRIAQVRKAVSKR
jgi:hypothetical protein